MKLKALLLALFTAGFAVSIGVAASPATSNEGAPTSRTVDGRLDHVRGKGREGRGEENREVQAREEGRRHR